MLVVDEWKATTFAIFPQTGGFLCVGAPVSSSWLLHEKKGIVEHVVVCDLDMYFVVSDLDVRGAPQRGKEMLFGQRIIDRPPRLKIAMRAPASERSVLHAGHLE